MVAYETTNKQMCEEICGGSRCLPSSYPHTYTLNSTGVMVVELGYEGVTVEGMGVRQLREWDS